MKKSLVLLFLPVLILMLVGCSQREYGENGSNVVFAELTPVRGISRWWPEIQLDDDIEGIEKVGNRFLIKTFDAFLVYLSVTEQSQETLSQFNEEFFIDNNLLIFTLSWGANTGRVELVGTSSNEGTLTLNINIYNHRWRQVNNIAIGGTFVTPVPSGYGEFLLNVNNLWIPRMVTWFN